MAHQSFATQVLTAALGLIKTRGEATTDELDRELRTNTRQARKRLLNTLSDLSKAGRLKRVRQGVYGPASAPRRPQLQEVMWRLLRMRRRITVADLIELAGCSTHYAEEWLRMLSKQQVVRRVPGPNNEPRVWQLINDTVAMPVDAAKAAKLTRLREQQRQRKLDAISAVNQAISSVEQARRELDEAVRKINNISEVENDG